MEKGSEAHKIDYPGTRPTEGGPDLKVVKNLENQAKENQRIVEEIQKEALPIKIPEKVKKYIINSVVSAVSLLTVGVGVWQYIQAGEEGRLPKISNLDLQKGYEQIAPGVRILFGLEEIQEETEKALSKIVEETTPPSEADVGEVVTPETTVPETKEFEASMIKNRLVFSESARQFNAAHPEAPFEFQPGAELPLWYLHDWSKEGSKVFSFVAAGVITGDLKKEIGETGREELLLPVAFQNPESGEFFVRDLSFGDSEFFETREAGPFGNYEVGDYRGGGIPRVFLDNYIYLGMEGYTMASTSFEELKKNFKVGDQMAFIILVEEEPGWAVDPNTELPEGINPNYPEIVEGFMRTYYSNNRSFYEAMKENKELPELKISPWVLILNKTEE